jgi:16S rRNA (guanine966-N2)-methyltransferase
MTRIIAGRAGGRSLLTPAGSGTRPTSDRVREAMFSRLQAVTELDSAVVLDLYAGSGALGLEAASRGAAVVCCVESDRAAARLIERNARALGLPGVEVATARVEHWLTRPARSEGFDLVLADPPYALSEHEVGRMLALLAPHLADGAAVMLERSTRSPDPAWPSGWAVAKSKRYGQSRVHLAHLPVPSTASG